jgi:hypothetical protein
VLFDSQQPTLLLPLLPRQLQLLLLRLQCYCRCCC